MFSTMTLRQKFTFMAVITSFLIIVLAGISLYSTRNLNKALGEVATTGQALGNFLFGDMMHDALKSDVLGSLLVAGGDKVSDHETLMADAKEHADSFIQSMKDNEALPLSPEIIAAIDKVKPALNAYIATSLKLVDLSFQDRAKAVAQMADFFKAFDHLADENGKVGEMIEEAVVSNREKSAQAAKTADTFIIGGAVITLVLFAALAVIIIRSIEAPLRLCSIALEKIGSGDTSVTIDYQSDDEVGAIANAVKTYRDSVIRSAELTEEQDQERKRKEVRTLAIEKMTAEFDVTATGSIKTLSSAASKLNSTAEGMSDTARQTTEQTAAVAAASDNASNNVQTVASASEELASTIQEISVQVAQANSIAGEAVNEVSEASSKIQGLAASSQKIGEVLGLITDIAEQTNLLALNATIEAARAGDAGKGFAVVASEVKNLANQTAKATEEIGSQITGIQSATQETVSAIEGIGEIVNKVKEISTAIAAAVEEQGAATQEIARNVELASQGTNEVSSNIEGVRQATENTGTISGDVVTASNTLTEESEKLRVQIEAFLKNIKAA